MYEPCDLCSDSGALRDGSACPHCTSRWKGLDGKEVVRPKRMIWIRANAQDTRRWSAIAYREPQRPRGGRA
jgi:hypothetical protein